MFVENSICSAGTLSVTRTVQVAMCPKVSWAPVIKTPVVIEKHHLPYQALTLGLWVQWPGGPVDLKTYWPPKKLTGPGGQ